MAPTSSKKLQSSYRAARAITRQHAKTFYFSSFPLPAHKRQAAFAVYAFCRHADDIIDRADDPATAEAAGQTLHILLDALYEGNAEISWGPAFTETVRRFGIPQALFSDLVRGVRMDAQPRVRIQTWEELLNYCYYVASVVGLVMSHILGADNPLRREAAKEQAIALGTAMQLTNILRDVREDLEKDRIYLPMRELAAHGVDVGRAAQGDGGNAWRDYALFFTARAREFYEEAERGIGTLDRDGSRYCVWCMRWIYAAILDEIEKAEWDISRRHRVGGWRKLSLAIRAWRSSMNTPS